MVRDLEVLTSVDVGHSTGAFAKIIGEGTKLRITPVLFPECSKFKGCRGSLGRGRGEYGAPP